jgi:hypothetical protein
VIPDEVLRRAQNLSVLAYSGFIFLLPTHRLRRYWELVDQVSHEIIGPALALWEELADELDAAVEDIAS